MAILLLEIVNILGYFFLHYFYSSKHEKIISLISNSECVIEYFLVKLCLYVWKMNLVGVICLVIKAAL